MDIHLPTEIEQFGPDLKFFLDMMVRKLHVNRHKGFIEGKTISLLANELQDEMSELMEALEEKSQFDVALECVDVSNQAFLLALACLHKSKDEWGQKDEHTRASTTEKTSPVSDSAKMGSGADYQESERSGA